tara:strand:- start:269 stop:646 length:378 start_codon:yes stop_codon:yes gene_type:complete
MAARTNRKKTQMKFQNLTPHSLAIESKDGRIITVPPSGIVARLAVTREARPVFVVNGDVFCVSRPTLGAITGLPNPEKGMLFVCSALVAEQAKRTDVVSVGELLRDANGAVVGARGLCSYAEAGS